MVWMCRCEAGAHLRRYDPTVADADIIARCGSGEDSVHIMSNRTGHTRTTSFVITSNVDTLLYGR